MPGIFTSIQMIADRVFDFLKLLEANNNREWFQANKFQYEQIKAEIETFTAGLIHGIAQFDKDIHHLKPADCLFRIYRDVRFSANKDPYKTHFGIFFAKGGKSSSNAGYYLHIENDKSMLGGGIYMPPANILKSIRQEIFFRSSDFKQILEEAEFKNTFGDLEPYKLKKTPKDFPKDFEDAELLKYNSFVVGKLISNDYFNKENLALQIADLFKIILPFIKYLNQAIEMKE